MNRITKKFAREIALLKDLNRWLHGQAFSAHDDELRSRILNAVRETPQDAPSNARRGFVLSTIRFPIFRFAASVGVGILAVGGLAVAAHGSLPGDTIYPIKKITESIELKLAVSTPAKALVQTKHAQERLRELAELEKEPIPAPELLRQTATEAETQFENALLSLTEAREEIRGREVRESSRERELHNAIDTLTSRGRQDLELDVTIATEVDADDDSTERKRNNLKEKFAEARKKRDEKREQARKEKEQKRQDDEQNNDNDSPDERKSFEFKNPRRATVPSFAGTTSPESVTTSNSFISDDRETNDSTSTKSETEWRNDEKATSSDENSWHSRDFTEEREDEDSSDDSRRGSDASNDD